MQFVAYYRVSTQKQGEDGLGMAAQAKAVTDYVNSRNGTIINHFIEVESGKRNNRPKLQTALHVCRRDKATLIIAKLDRLARNVHFISGLMEAGIEFVAVDNPNANRLMLHMLAAFAEHEREQISQRTKNALKAAKERGVKLGRYGAEVLAPQNRSLGMANITRYRNILEQLRAEGYTTTRAVCEQLNLRQIPTAKGGSAKWHIPTVYNLLKRIRTHSDFK